MSAEQFPQRPRGPLPRSHCDSYYGWQLRRRRIRIRDPTTQKSAHYGISRAGIVHQYVQETDTAFHAGIVVRATWTLLKPKVNPNFYTIGIEHEGTADDVWPSEQLNASSALIAQIAARWKISLDENHVIFHHQIRASKTCPGNWLRDVSTLLNLIPNIDEQVAAVNPVVIGVPNPEPALSSA
jgi:N-acetyl-anhydromuramyl-L-alanine amidase AmpD